MLHFEIHSPICDEVLFTFHCIWLLQENKALKMEKATTLTENEKLRLSVKEEEMVREQLMVQMSALKGDKEKSSKLKEELATTKLE